MRARLASCAICLAGDLCICCVFLEQISLLNLLWVISEQEGVTIEELNAGRVCDWFLKDKLDQAGAQPRLRRPAHLTHILHLPAKKKLTYSTNFFVALCFCSSTPLNDSRLIFCPIRFPTVVEMLYTCNLMLHFFWSMTFHRPNENGFHHMEKIYFLFFCKNDPDLLSHNYQPKIIYVSQVKKSASVDFRPSGIAINRQSLIPPPHTDITAVTCHSQPASLSRHLASPRLAQATPSAEPPPPRSSL
jgi:hypothetical protein